MKHPLRGLLVAQFFGAFNDNAWKMMAIMIALAAIGTSELPNGQVDEVAKQAAQQQQTMFGMVVFSLSMMIFSMPAGALCDRASKRTVIIATKALELTLMIAATVVLWLSPLGTTGPFILLALMGLQSALFGPAKYGILPELLPHEQLSHGNGLLQMWTMLAIIAGTALGPFLLTLGGSITAVGPSGLILLAVVGLIAAISVPRVPAARAEGGMAHTLRLGWSAIRADRMIALTIVGTMIYWTALSLLGQNVIVYTTTIVEGVSLPLLEPEAMTGIPFALFGAGLAAGAVLAGRLSAGKIEHGLIPLGAGAFGLLTLLIGIVEPVLIPAIVVLILMGICAGFVIVPLGATLQWRAPEDRRGAVIAISAVVNTAGMIGGSITAYVLAKSDFDTGAIFITAGGFVLLATVWATILLPLAVIRMCFVIMAHTVYRFNVIGRHHVPERGGALLVSNHVSLIDAVFVTVVLDRSVRIIMHEPYTGRWWLKLIGRALKSIPMSSTAGTREMLQAFKQAGKSLDDGHLVCVFPEGQATRTGMLNTFRGETKRIVKGRDVPFVPVYLDQTWGSIFSFESGRFVAKWPRRIPYPVTVAFGEPLPADSSPWQLRQALMELGTEAWHHRRSNRRPLHHQFIRQVRRRPFALAFGDESRATVSRIKALAGVITLGRLLRSKWDKQRRVGVLLPPSVPAAMVNIAAAVSGRTSVNLNYTAGPAALASAITQADLKTVITSPTFLEKLKIELPDTVEAIDLKDLTGGVGARSKLCALLLAMFVPTRVLEHACGADRKITIDDELTIIFSSGSTGEPKGVVLTHDNLGTNTDGVAQVFPVSRRDKILGILPLFHSFGYMTLWLSANNGMGVVFHPNPLDTERIGQLVYDNRVTMLIATPTFLQLYLRRCEPGVFGSLHVVLTGAEKLTDRLADAFEQRFGIRPIEGYGTTECSPVIAASTLDVRYEGIYQPGSRRGSVGQPLPGVSVRVVDPDTFEALGPNKPGMLLVMGANVMQGYLGRDELTRQVMRDGWYVTGDIAMIDDDGFIKITDRLSRFSKIGGEMVPHGRVEQTLQEVAGEDVQVFAVTGIPDERKGERLAVLHTIDPSQIPQLLEKVVASGLPNLFIPRQDDFVKVEELPILGTGKLDLREVKNVATKALGTTI